MLMILNGSWLTTCYEFFWINCGHSLGCQKCVENNRFRLVHDECLKQDHRSWQGPGIFFHPNCNTNKNNGVALKIYFTLQTCRELRLWHEGEPSEKRGIIFKVSHTKGEKIAHKFRNVLHVHIHFAFHKGKQLLNVTCFCKSWNKFKCPPTKGDLCHAKDHCSCKIDTHLEIAGLGKHSEDKSQMVGVDTWRHLYRVVPGACHLPEPHGNYLWSFLGHGGLRKDNREDDVHHFAGLTLEQVQKGQDQPRDFT